MKVDRFVGIEVPVPPLDEQQKIARRLNRIGSLIEVASEIGSEIVEDTQALVQNMHFHLAEPSKRQLGEFLELREDRVSVEAECHYPQVGVRGFVGGLFFKEAVLGSETTYKSFNRLSSGLLVVSQPKGWEGAVAVCTSAHEGWFVSPEYRTFRCRPNFLDERYLAAFLTTPWFQQMLTRLVRGQGARRQRLRPEMLLGVPMRMPAIEHQRASLRCFDALRRIRAVRFDTNQHLRGILRAVTQDAFEPEFERRNTSSA